MSFCLLLSLLSALLTSSLSQASEALNCVHHVRSETLKRWGPSARVYQCGSADSGVETSRVISEALQDSGDCLGVSWREIFPKLMLESGFVETARGRDGERGVGQLTAGAIQDVVNRNAYFWQVVQKGETPACRRLRQKIETWGVENFFRTPGSEPCQFVAGDVGIYRNLFFSVAFHSLNKSYVDRFYRDLKIPDIMRAAGADFIPHDQIKTQLVFLAYNNGARSAVLDLRNFLRSRIDFIDRKKEELWKLSAEERSRGSTVASFLGYVSLRDFDFRRGQKRFEKLLQQIPPGLDHIEASTRLRNVSASQLGFPEWLRIWQTNGGPGYVTSVYNHGARMQSTYPGCIRLDHFEVED